MKKKIYFSISAILQILASLYSILNINSYIQLQINMIPETYSMFSDDVKEKMIIFLQTDGDIYYSIIFAIPILLNLFILKNIFKNNILKKKGMFIIFSIICLFTTGSIVVVILSIVNFIILLCLKRKNPEDYPVKKQIPRVDNKKNTKKEIILGSVVLISYFFQLILSKIIENNLSKTMALIVALIYYVFLIVLLILTFKDKLIKDIKLFKNNSKEYIRYVLPRVVAMYIIFIISRLITIMITKQVDTANQTSMGYLSLVTLIILGILWAPIVEELVFRGAIRRLIKNDTIFILISALIFGIMHTIGEPTILNIVVMAIPYSVLGGFLAYIYAKTDNLTNNILVHLFNNAISIFFMIFYV